MPLSNREKMSSLYEGFVLKIGFLGSLDQREVVSEKKGNEGQVETATQSGSE